MQFPSGPEMRRIVLEQHPTAAGRNESPNPDKRYARWRIWADGEPLTAEYYTRQDNAWRAEYRAVSVGVVS